MSEEDEDAVLAAVAGDGDERADETFLGAGALSFQGVALVTAASRFALVDARGLNVFRLHQAGENTAGLYPGHLQDALLIVYVCTMPQADFARALTRHAGLEFEEGLAAWCDGLNITFGSDAYTELVDVAGAVITGGYANPAEPDVEDGGGDGGDEGKVSAP